MAIVPREIRNATRPTDFIKADRLLSEEEKGIRDRVREFVDREVIPSAADHWHRAEFRLRAGAGRGSARIGEPRHFLARPERPRDGRDPRARE